MHDSGATQQTRAFVGYQKLRASIAVPIATVGSNASEQRVRMTYFKADNECGRLVASVQEEVDGSKLCGSKLTRDELIERLFTLFPMFSRVSIEQAVNAVVPM